MILLSDCLGLLSGLIYKIKSISVCLITVARQDGATPRSLMYVRIKCPEISNAISYFTSLDGIKNISKPALTAGEVTEEF